LLYSICRNDTVRNIILIIASLVFYAFGEPVAIFVMLISVIFNYLFGLLCAGVIGKRGKDVCESGENVCESGEDVCESGEDVCESGEGVCESGEDVCESGENVCDGCSGRLWLVLAVILNIGLLFVYKYADFFLENIGLQELKLNAALPIGISFFTFQGLSYVVDVYRDKKCVQKKFLSVMLYISFFPQLIAGPIVKYHDIKEQLNHREFNIDRISQGLQRFIFGLGKKVLIAGPMGLMADRVYSLSVSDFGSASAWIAAISYMMQIYFDFSGYSDMAIGLGCIFGFDFKENFDKPYSAGNMQQFWRRWHISLSTWFKEYVYIPLGGNRKGRIRTYINKFIVFSLTGLWHGANWTFVCWGVLHGLALIAEDCVKRKFEGHKLNGSIHSVAGHIYTLFFVMVSFIVFRADNLRYAAGMIGRLFVGGGSNSVAFSLVTPMYIAAMVFAVILSSHLCDKLFSKVGTWVWRVLSIFIYVLSLAMLIIGGYNPFIYFRF